MRNKILTGICGSRLSTYSVRPRQASNVMLSVSAKAWMVSHTSPRMSLCHFGIREECGQLPVIMKLVIVHHFMHLLPSDIGL